PTRHGGSIEATFSEKAAFATLTGATPGSHHAVKVTFTDDGTAKSETERIEVGRCGEGRIEAEVRPDHWCDVAGTINVRLHGDVADVDLASIKLTGDGGTSVSPTAPPTRHGDSIDATFDEKAAFATLAGATPGSKHA